MTQSTASTRSLYALALFAVLLMSFVPVTIKFIDANEATIGIVRLSIAALGIAVILRFKQSFTSITKKELGWLILLGIIFAGHWYTYFKSIKLANASLAAIGVATYGIHLLFLNRIFYREKLNIIDLAAVCVAFFGIYLTAPTLDLSNQKASGFFFAIISGLLYAGLPLINRKMPHLSTNTRALGQFGFALVIFCFLLPQANFSLSTNNWFWLVFLGVVSTLVAHTLWLKTSTELPTQITAVLYYCYVPLTIILSFFVLNEPLNWEKLVGAGLIIAANITVAWAHTKRK